MSDTIDKDVLPKFIERAIKMRLEEEAKKLIEEAKKDIERRTPEIVASVIVDLMSMVSFEDSKERVVFTIRKSPLNQN